MFKHKVSILTGALALAIVGCDSDSSSTDTTPFSLAVSDAAIDEVDEVVIVVSKVALKSGSDPIVFNVYLMDEEGNPIDEDGNPLEEGEDPIPLSIDLLQYQGGESLTLINEQVVPVGQYQMCLFVHDGDHPDYPSYVIESENTTSMPLSVSGNGKCPTANGEEDEFTGILFFNNAFTINTPNNDYVVEFDLRRGLKEATGNDEGFTIQRTSVSLVNTILTGEISGTVSSTLYDDCETDTESITGYAHALYLYQGDVDIDSMTPFAEGGPVTAANVVLDEETNMYRYEFGFISEGDYSLGYTCTANDDSEDGIVENGEFSIYRAESNISVVADEDTTVDFN
ncbi:DUF4382 domain-containing protein [Vibrio astriarenae]|uniref:DUF4382 domain-containing protein n=1 Tax=Vibrio astriarenae TaxID=1481923 RepID=A0A7Z2T7V9_9VIBR|nr:DUF4382 domain-containing protein [Vibrio astriarenae]QIA66014.1 DUF4382 domain-containing protein [Vibrio astriarenae]